MSYKIAICDDIAEDAQSIASSVRKWVDIDTYALRHVNLKFKVGRKLAVVGMNGSGKTTFIKLMCRLYGCGCSRKILRALVCAGTILYSLAM